MDSIKIVLFKDKKIRRTLYNNEWWFVIEDVVLALIDSNDSKQYIQRLKQRDEELAKGWVQIVHTLDVPTEGGNQKMNCANPEGIFRIVQSIPSPKAEPFKRWLARVGYERMQEIENPELATKRTRILYKLKGYPDDWIEKRMRGIAIREELTDEWSKRGAQEQKDYEILTAEISKATFGITPTEYKELKSLKRENLRDHMDDLHKSGIVIEEPKCNFDVEMTMDMLDDIDKATAFILFSGDSDMRAPLERLKVKGKKIGIVGVRGKVAGELHSIKDKFFDFGKLYTGKKTYIKSENPAS